MRKIQSFLADFTRLSERQSDKIAVLDSFGRSLNYRNLFDYVDKAQAFLISHGVNHGDTVVALLPNAIETLVFFLACLRGGYTYAPLPCTSTLVEVRQWKELTQSHMCLIASPVSNSVKVQIADMEWNTLFIPIGGDFEWMGDSTSEPGIVGRLIMASSGSTGEPKAIVLDGDRLWSSALAFLRYHQIDTNDIRFWNYLPMSYLGGLFNLGLIPLAAGGSIYIDDPFSGKTFLTFWSIVERFKINSLWLVPSILRGLLTLAERVGQAILPTCVERCYVGTAPISLQEKRKFLQVFGIEPLENYGLSETTFISSEHSHNLALRREGGVGSVMPDIDVKLSEIEVDGVTMQEILVRTPFFMLGYLDRQGVLQIPLDDNGFMRSGDYGRFSDGQLLITGRRRDIIKKGGILIPLREIELLAEGVDGILEAAAARVEHPFYGESFHLYILTKQPVRDEKAFLSHFSGQLHEQLVRHKWPDQIFLCSDFPRTISGKVQKHLLNARQINYDKP